mgnify:CR=1 FL=1
MTLDEIRTYLLVEFDQVFGPEFGVTLDSAEAGEAVVRLAPARRHLRPGGILSGPTLMALADAAAYAALLSLDAHAKMAVTTNLSINFLRAAPAEGDLLTRCRTLKNGRRLAVLEAEAVSEGSEEIIAHTVLTYSIPPR